jgi:hypothetical protein
MITKLYNEPFPYVQIDNTYTEEEIKLIFLELDFINSRGFMKPPEMTAASHLNGVYKKIGTGLFLDLVYSEKSLSNILTLNRKIYDFERGNLIGDMIGIADCDTTLVNYYDNSGEYRAHQDTAFLTAVTILYKKPKVFTGGDLYFPTYTLKLESVYNRTYIFPGSVPHGVYPVIIPEDYMNKGLGRYSITNFINFKHIPL